MSLISDALRRARREASRSAPEHGRVPASLRAPRRGDRPSLAVVFLVALAAAVAGAGVVWVMAVHVPPGAATVTGNVQTPAAEGTDGTPAEAASAVSRGGGPVVEPAASSAKGPASSPGETPRSVTAPPGSVGAGSGGAVPGPVTRDGERLPGNGGVRSAGGVAARVPGSGRRGARAAPRGRQRRSSTGGGNRPDGAEAGGAGAPGGPREIHGEGTVDGVHLTLDYLVYRANDPFAQINGNEVHVGWQVDGFTVLAIDEDSVRLQGKHGPVILRAH